MVWILELVELGQIPGSKLIIVILNSFVKVVTLCDSTAKIEKRSTLTEKY